MISPKFFYLPPLSFLTSIRDEQHAVTCLILTKKERMSLKILKSNIDQRKTKLFSIPESMKINMIFLNGK